MACKIYFEKAKDINTFEKLPPNEINISLTSLFLWIVIDTFKLLDAKNNKNYDVGDDSGGGGYDVDDDNNNCNNKNNNKNFKSK